MTVGELLQALETLPHTGRVRTMIDLGRRKDAESQALIATLEAGGFYERFMALYACFGSQDREHVLRALADQSRIIRGLALRLLPLVCDDEQLQQTLNTAQAELYLPLLWKLRQRKQQAAIDALLERLAAQDNMKFCQVLPFGSPALVGRFAERFRQEATQSEWTRLARFHPVIALDLLHQWASASVAQDATLLHYVNALLPLLAQASGERAFDLVQTMRRMVQLNQLRLQPLVQQYPSELADLVAQEKTWLSISFTGVVDRLTVSQIMDLYIHHTAMIGWYYSWVRQLSPEKRLAVFQAGERRFRHKGALPKEIVENLPRALREQEASKALSRPHLTPTEQLNYAALLPWAEALKQLEPLLHTNDTGIRQRALQALIQTVKYQRSHLADALTLLRTYRTEHDPVRRVMLQGLTYLPLSIWQEAHLSDLAEIIRHGLNDVGLSPETLKAITALLIKLLPVHPDWSAAQLATVLRERGLSPAATGERAALLALSDEQALHLLDALLPMMHIWMEEEKEDSILQVARWFSPYEPAFAVVLPLLEDLLQRTRSPQTAEAILAIIARRQFDHLQTLIPALVQADASWITLASVSEYLFRHRQDVLSPFLRFQPYAGRWTTGRKRFLFPLPRRFAGGTAQQQETFALALMEIITDDTQESKAITQAVKTLLLLPAIPQTRLAVLANDSNSVVRTTALFALGRLDNGQGLPTLIEALQDTRARIAIPALRSFLGKMPSDQALAIIRSIPMNRVTIAKERVRLTGELASEEAYLELLALERRKLHRDVRTVLVRTLATYVASPATWPILEEAARSADVETAMAALPRDVSPQQYDETVQGETETVEQHILRLMLLLLNHPESRVRLAALRSGWLPIQDQQRLLLSRALELLRSSSSIESQAAARAIVTICRENDGLIIAQALRNLLPNRRLLLTLKDAFQPANIQNRRACCLLFARCFRRWLKTV